MTLTEKKSGFNLGKVTFLKNLDIITYDKIWIIYRTNNLPKFYPDFLENSLYLDFIHILSGENQNKIKIKGHGWHFSVRLCLLDTKSSTCPASRQRALKNRTLVSQ